jgi:hypothetical protein
MILTDEDTTSEKPKDGFDDHCQRPAAKPRVNVDEEYRPSAIIWHGNCLPHFYF